MPDEGPKYFGSVEFASERSPTSWANGWLGPIWLGVESAGEVMFGDGAAGFEY